MGCYLSLHFRRAVSRAWLFIDAMFQPIPDGSFVRCSLHNHDGRTIACYLQWDGTHMPTTACRCFDDVLKCPIELHVIQYLQTTADWSD